MVSHLPLALGTPFGTELVMALIACVIDDSEVEVALKRQGWSPATAAAVISAARWLQTEPSFSDCREIGDYIDMVIGLKGYDHAAQFTITPSRHRSEMGVFLGGLTPKIEGQCWSFFSV